MERRQIVVTINSYMAAWNETDTGMRLRLLTDCWAEQGRYVDPTVELRGRDSLSRHITAVQAARPGSRLEFVSAIDTHHDVLRFLWRLVRADGTSGDTSVDFGELDGEGRITRMIGFFGAAPEIGAVA